MLPFHSPFLNVKSTFAEKPNEFWFLITQNIQNFLRRKIPGIID